MPVLFGNRAAFEHTLQYSYVMLMLLGILGLIRRVRREDAGLLYPFVSYVVLTSLLVFYELRYRIVTDPVMVIFAALLLAGRRERDVEDVEKVD
jgi:hypothetical protein